MQSKKLAHIFIALITTLVFCNYCLAEITAEETAEGKGEESLNLLSSEKRELLRKDIVRYSGEDDNLLTLEKFVSMKIKSETENFTIKIYSVAPAVGLISRDQLIAITNLVVIQTLLKVAGNDNSAITINEYMKNVSLKPFYNETGKFDMAISLYFRPGGITVNVESKSELGDLNDVYEKQISWTEVL